MKKNSLKKHSIVNIQEYKHDGKLYRQWNGVKVLDVKADSIVLFLYKTKVKQVKGSKWIIKEPHIWFIPLNGFFNTRALIRKSGIHYYSNLSSPPVFEENTIKIIDYEIDIKAYPKFPIKIVDEKEFWLNKIKYNYSKLLSNKIIKSANKVVSMIKNKKGFFNEKKFINYLNKAFKLNLISESDIK